MLIRRGGARVAEPQLHAAALSRLQRGHRGRHFHGPRISSFFGGAVSNGRVESVGGARAAWLHLVADWKISMLGLIQLSKY